MDRVIDKVEPKLEAMVETTERLSAPLRGLWQKTLGRWVKRVDAPSPEKLSRAQMSEITNLFHADENYSRDERKRLETVLEALGQKDALPDRELAPPDLMRDQLRSELPKPESRLDFMRFLLVVADYDLVTAPKESKYLDRLAEDLDISPGQMDNLRQERALQATL